jgi:NAD(P)-dependent dehydrogenase (short-subunit alcohol dehydrogenase family)
LSDAGFGRPSLAVVVGASGGLGRALAELMVESGAGFCAWDGSNIPW